jgi:hypothetical protein
MVQRIHQKLGTAGFVISILALVIALGGGAYAAKGGLTGKQKTEVQKIAKTEAQKVAKSSPGKPGATGPQGPAGAAGAKGDTGAKGDAGAAGTNGAAGAQGLEGPEGPEGPAGKTGFASALPSGETEIGAWSTDSVAAGQTVVYSSISAPFGLAAEYPLVFVTAEELNEEENGPECPSKFVEISAGAFELTPEAKPGFFCVYETTGFGMKFSTSFSPETGESGIAGHSGAVLQFIEGEEFGFARGTWAVTAN